MKNKRAVSNAMKNKSGPVILYFCAGIWRGPFPVGELRYPIRLLAEKYDVIFVEPPVTIRDLWKNPGRLLRRRKSRGRRRLTKCGMTILTPWTPLPYSPRLPLPRFLRRLILKLSARMIAAQSLKLFRRLFPQREKPDIAWGTIFRHAPLLRKVPARTRLAIINDNFPESPVFSASGKKEVAALERELLEAADYYFTTSRTLLEDKADINPKGIPMENGVSRFFLPENEKARRGFAGKRPEEEKRRIDFVKKLPRPLIGYTGAVNVRLQKEIIDQLARLPEPYHLCFVGKIDDSFPRDAARALRSNPRIRFIPYVSHVLIPDLLNSFDVLLLPFAKTSFSRYINPLKLHEYLSSGKPIVSTKLPEVVRIAGAEDGLVYFLENPEDTMKVIEKALREDGPERRRARIELARNRTWEKTTKEMRALVARITGP